MPEWGTTECDKLHKARPISQEIGEFLEWCGEQGYVLCDLQPRGPQSIYQDYMPLGKTKEQLLADYFDIDLHKVDDERRAILDSLRGGCIKLKKLTIQLENTETGDRVALTFPEQLTPDICRYLEGQGILEEEFGAVANALAQALFSCAEGNVPEHFEKVWAYVENLDRFTKERTDKVETDWLDEYSDGQGAGEEGDSPSA